MSPYSPSVRSRDIADAAGVTIEVLRARLRARVAAAVASHWLDDRTAQRLVRRADACVSIRALVRLAEKIPRLSPVLVTPLR